MVILYDWVCKEEGRLSERVNKRQVIAVMQMVLILTCLVV